MNRSIALITLAVLGCLMSAAAPIDGRFNYQARLTSGGVPITGVVDARFSLWDAAAAGAQISSSIEFLGEAVSDGLYNADLDFGVAALNGDMRWLQVEVRTPAGVGAYVILGRREILGMPYAIQTRGIFVDDDKKVGIGTNTPIAPLHVESDDHEFTIYARNNLTDLGFGGVFLTYGDAGIAVVGEARATTGNATGGYFETASPNGHGVFGSANADTGPTYGGKFRSSSTSGRGVSATASASSGGTYGGYFLNYSTIGKAVYGHANASTGQNFGGLFECAGDSGRAVFGSAYASSGQNYGGYFQSASSSGHGVYGWAKSNSGITDGVLGQADSTAGRGVFGLATASTGTTYGMYGSSASTSGRAVFGWASATTGQTYGLNGRSDSSSGRGVYGWASASSGLTDGVFGHSNSTAGRGVCGWAQASTGTTYGVVGQSNSTSGRGVYGIADANSGVNYGVIGRSDSPTGFDFYASGAGTNYGASSSRRWKNNIEPISDPLRKLAKLRGVYFDWDDEHGGQHDVGMIAEEVGKVLPEIVNYEENGHDAIGMDYSKMTPLLVEALNALRMEHGEKIDVLQAENALLRAQLESLTNRFDAMASPEPKSLTSNTGNAR